MPADHPARDATFTGIDSHAHVFPRELGEAAGRRYVPDYAAPIERYLSVLQAHGMSHGVLVQPSFLGTDNRYLLACLDAHPAQLRGVVVLDPAADPAMLADYDARGVVGVRANLIGRPPPDFSDPAWSALLRRMRAMDWHLEIQVECRHLAAVAAPVLALGVRLVVDHFGRIDPATGVADPGFADLLALGATNRTWVKVSGAYRISAPGASRRDILDAGRAAYGRLREAFGAARLLWGSDWPYTQHEDTEDYGTALALLDAVTADDAERRQLLVGTARELFRF